MAHNLTKINGVWCDRTTRQPVRIVRMYETTPEESSEWGWYVYLCPCGAEWAGNGYEQYGQLSGSCSCAEGRHARHEALDNRYLSGTTHGVLCEECDALLTEDDRNGDATYRQEWEDNERYVCTKCLDHTRRTLGITPRGGW